MAQSVMADLPSGLRLHCRIEGPEGAPWVVLGNSNTTELSLWDDGAAALRGRYRVLRYDQRGHGKSSVPPPPYSVPQMAGDVVALLDHFRIAQAHYVGVAMGGFVGLALATFHQDRLASLVAAACGLNFPPPQKKNWDERIALALREGVAPIADQLIPRWFPKAAVAANTPAVRRVRAMMLATHVNGFVGGASALRDVELGDGLEKITIPCLLIAGTEDGNRVEVMQNISKRIPGSRVEAIAGAGHLVNLEQPEAFNKLVLAFLAGVDAGTA